MNKKLYITAVAVCAGFLTLIASTVSASACWFWNYQPEEPKSLRK